MKQQSGLFLKLKLSLTNQIIRETIINNKRWKSYLIIKKLLKTCLNHDRFLLAMDMGLGKTITALYWLKLIQKQNNYNTLIVVNSSKVSDWSLETRKLKLQNQHAIVQAKQINELIASVNQNFQIFIISYRRLLSVIQKSTPIHETKVKRDHRWKPNDPWSKR